MRANTVVMVFLVVVVWNKTDDLPDHHSCPACPLFCLVVFLLLVPPPLVDLGLGKARGVGKLSDLLLTPGALFL